MARGMGAALCTQLLPRGRWLAGPRCAVRWRRASAGGRLGPRHEKDRWDQERETKGQNGGSGEIEGYRQFMGGGLPPSLQVSGRGGRVGGRVGVIKTRGHKDGDWCPGESHGATEMGHAENQRNAQGCVQHLQGPGVVGSRAGEARRPCIPEIPGTVWPQKHCPGVRRAGAAL